MSSKNVSLHTDDRAITQGSDSGFALAELLVSAFILLVICSAVFGMLSETQHAAGYQTETQTVLSNVQIAMQLVERCIRQAGNDPLKIGLTGITIVSPTEVRIQSDLTGSRGPGEPDKGDPDGDINDSGENVAIRYNNAARTLEIVPGGGPAQIAAGEISGFSLQYFDASGNPTTAGNDVRKIRVAISGAGSTPNPQTHQIFGVQLVSDIQIATRQ
jgi:type II secretory pathway pseudopilin PulG